MTAPYDHTTYGGLITDCARVTGSAPDITWVDDGFLLDHGVEPWTGLPLWRPYPGTWRVDAARARAAGLTCRPLSATIADTWSWLAPGRGESDLGLAPAIEARLLAAWAARAHPV